MKKPARLFVILTILSALFTLLILYAYFVEPNRLVVENIHLSTEKLPGDISPLKIVQLSDIHIGTLNPTLVERTIDLANKQNAHMVVITGDAFSRSRIFEQALAKQFSQELNRITTFLTSLRASYGVYAVRGNNDFSDDKEVSDIYLDNLRKHGIHVLTDQKIVIEHEGEEIFLLGLDFPEFEHDVVADFYVRATPESHVLQSDESEKNSYSHYFDLKNENKWQNYTVSGKMRTSHIKKSGIGFVFYSQFHNGYDRFYRIRWSPSLPHFVLSPHGTHITGGDLEIPISPENGKWIQLKAKVTTKPHQTEIVAKMWSENANEPHDWMLRAFDNSPNRLMGGTLGAWSALQGIHQFDDLLVVTNDGDTLLHENFEHIPDGCDPPGWVDFNRSQEALPILMRNIPDTCMTILLGHTPDLIRNAEPLGIDLLLSGHTHGGQVRLPIFGATAARISIGRKYAAGLHTFGNSKVYVNRGLGTIVLPFRFLCPPEVTVLTLRGKQ